jgi:hypothetical protein
MMSCHVSEKWKIGPVTPHTTMTPSASRKAHEEPIISEVRCEKRRNTPFRVLCLSG